MTTIHPLQQVTTTNLYQLKIEMGLSIAFTPIYEYAVIAADNLKEAILKFENNNSYNFDEKHLCDNQGYGGFIEDINIYKENISPYKIEREKILLDLKEDIELRYPASDSIHF